MKDFIQCFSRLYGDSQCVIINGRNMTNTLVNRYDDYIVLVKLVLSRAHKNKSRAEANRQIKREVTTVAKILF